VSVLSLLHATGTVFINWLCLNFNSLSHTLQSLSFEALLSDTTCFLNSHLETKISNSMSQDRASQFQTGLSLQALMRTVTASRYLQLRC